MAFDCKIGWLAWFGAAFSPTLQRSDWELHNAKYQRFTLLWE